MQNRIRALRKERGWTLSDLAARIKPTPPTAQTIARLETGTRTLSLPWLEKIAAAFDVSPQDLLTLSQGPSSPIIGVSGLTAIKPLKTPPEIDLSVLAADPVAIEFESQRGTYGPGDILVFDRQGVQTDIVIDEALVETTDGLLVFGSLFPEIGDQPMRMCTPPPAAAMHSLGQINWAARAVCLIRRFER
ncbi:MAG: helix-turn-helix transcriptional regulator [Sphingomonadales bacterium]